MNVIKCAKRFDYLRMRLIFFKLVGAYRNSHSVNAEAGVKICRISLNIVYSQSEFTDGRYKVLKVVLVFKFKMYFKMV